MQKAVLITCQTQKKERFLLKTLSFLLTFIYITTQVVGAQDLSLLSKEKSNLAVPVVSAENSAQTPQPVVKTSTSQDFLLDQNSLRTREDIHLNDEYEKDFYEFDDALEMIRPEFSVAIPLRSITEAQLEELRNLDVEVALIAVKGVKFLLTSGQHNEIRTHAAINKLLAEADFIAHTHPEETESSEPSRLDYLAASKMPEYLITPDRVLSFNKEGILDRNILAGELLKIWDRATKNNRRPRNGQPADE